MRSDPRRQDGFAQSQRTSSKAQRGSVAVVAAIWIAVALIVLGSIDVGNLYFQRRDLQRVADMTALAAVQSVNDLCPQTDTTVTASGSNAVVTAAYRGAALNGFDAQASGNSMSVACGRWDVSDYGASAGYFGTATNQLNAVRVVATKTVPLFFIGPPRTISAASTAKASNIDTFSIGTTLAMFGSNQDCAGNSVSADQRNTGLVNALLGALLNTSLSLNIGSYQALACTRVKVGDLVKAQVGAGTVDQLLATKLTLNQLVSVMVTALKNTSVANLGIYSSASSAALDTLAHLTLPGGQIPIGDSSNAPGLLSLGIANTQAAADASVSLLDLLFTAAEIANANAKSPAVNVNTGLNLLGLAQATLQVQVIRPPTIAIGEGGTDPLKPAGTWRTSAHTADVAVYLNIGVGTWDLSGISAQVQLPVYLEVAPGTAVLTSTSCAATAADSRAYITATPGLLNACVGDAPLNKYGMMDVSSGYSCSKTATLVHVDVPGIALDATVPAISVPGVASAGGSLVFDGISGNSDDYQSTSSGVGHVLANALSGPVAALSSSAGLVVNATLAGIPIRVSTGLIGNLLALLTQSTLNRILGALDQLLLPLLQLLGVQVGVATVHNMSLACGVAQTVGN
ncbi:TadG family pilus assembly protein [Burkholderia multivorans]|uniref:TadG family pilus assembly protein n=1 Tax=Burkholderia multivorans TaxID=87883 RepID=UPI0020B42B64|nr:TadG family pilus assembly protein [Burkholderia multivorans]